VQPAHDQSGARDRLARRRQGADPYDRIVRGPRREDEFVDIVPRLLRYYDRRGPPEARAELGLLRGRAGFGLSSCCGETACALPQG